MKICYKCKIEKQLIDFNKNKCSKDGLHSYCRACCKDYNKKYLDIEINKQLHDIRDSKYYENNKDRENKKRKKYYWDNREKLLEKQKKFTINNPDIMKIRTRKINARFSCCKSKSKKRNLEWTLILDQFSELIDQPCYYCNNLLGAKSETSYGLDRMDNSKGYHIDNVCSCCLVCNRIKSDVLSVQETIVAVKSILQQRYNNHIIDAEID